MTQEPERTKEPERRDVAFGALLDQLGKVTPAVNVIAPLLKAAKWRAVLMWAVLADLLVTLGLFLWWWHAGTLKANLTGLLVPSIVLGVLIYIFSSVVSTWSSIRALAEGEKASAVSTLRAEELQEKLDENFFTNLVKINFKYLDQYYLQTQLQANKSFFLCSIAASVSLTVLLGGIVMLFLKPNQTQAGYVATAAGTLGEFISAVFFYLYNQTIIKMGEYHQKLVLTQNVSLALKISEGLPDKERWAAQSKLIEYLSKDVNRFLTARAESGPDNYGSSRPTRASRRPPRTRNQ
jgi:hypothetical protein